MNTELEKWAKEDWYTQACPGKPLYMIGVGGLGIMQKSLGFSYRAIMATYKEDFAEWKYISSDLQKNAKIVFDFLGQDPLFLDKCRQIYDRQVAEIQTVFQKSLALESYSEKELVDYYHVLHYAYPYTVGTSHLIESVAMAFEQKIRHLLMDKGAGKSLNSDFSVLTTPLSQSYISKREGRLWEIRHSQKAIQEKLISEFLQDFYWFKTSYAGVQPVSRNEIEQEAADLTGFSKPDFKALFEAKQELFHKYDFSEKEQALIQWTDFVTEWQDDRKKKILTGTFATHAAASELSKRFNVPLIAIEYLVAPEVTMERLKNGFVQKTGLERRNGFVGIELPTGFLAFEPSDYQEYLKFSSVRHAEIEMLNGTPASLGTATGPVKICTTIDSIGKVKPGDVLVASMTRPEYVPAMKKAAAIITDEGGITCHAAIVSRELGIPCIIGTRNATKVLKDGWIVQVKANHGQVVVLEKGAK